jgi:predicted MFS family arabinose efflux permease
MAGLPSTPIGNMVANSNQHRTAPVNDPAAGSQGRSNLPDRRILITALGVTQILAWGSTYYLLAVLAAPIAADTGWSLTWTVGALSLGLLVAGFAAPRVGRAIETWGGRPVLGASAGLCALGLALLAMSPYYFLFAVGWVVLGLAMAAGLYDAAFSTLGRLYGENARQAITALTLFGGLASTVCWPLTAYLNEALGWRGACLVYAALHLAVACPIYFFILPRESKRQAPASGSPEALPRPTAAPLLFILLATTFALAAAVSSVNSVHLLMMLQSRDIALPAAVALGALVGPAQVTARVVEMVIGRYHHPIWTLVASVLFVAAGIALLWSAAPIIAAALMLYGAGIGIHSIARGTVPLALFGSEGYATLMGRLARPGLIAGAVSPTLGALVLDWAGTDATLGVLCALTLVNVAITAAIVVSTQRN